MVEKLARHLATKHNVMYDTLPSHQAEMWRKAAQDILDVIFN